MVTNPLVLDGKWLAQQILDGVAMEAMQLSSRVGRPPGLAVLLVGDNPASKVYVQNKSKAAKKCGFATFDMHLPADASFAAVQEVLVALNSDAKVDGVLVQLPLSPQLDASAVIDCISPAKDADGLHPLNQGLLLRGQARLRPCTPAGVMKLIDLALASSDLRDLKQLRTADLSGRTAIVLGRSMLVGKPLAFMLLERNATVVMAHSRSSDLPHLCSTADIVIAAVGKPQLVKREWIKQGAIVIDVGINRIEAGPQAGKLCGDVAYDQVAPLCAAITPVPGGVGPMTVAMLIQNTFEAYRACNL